MTMSPSSISTDMITSIAFGLTASIIGLVTLWQGYRAWTIWHDHRHDQLGKGDFSLALHRDESKSVDIELGDQTSWSFSQDGMFRNIGLTSNHNMSASEDENLAEPDKHLAPLPNYPQPVASRALSLASAIHLKTMQTTRNDPNIHP